SCVSPRGAAIDVAGPGVEAKRAGANRAMISAFVRVLLCIGAALFLASPAAAQTGPVVETPAGKVRGEAAGDLRVFKGIPYAQARVGALRWRPPARLARWRGVREATQFGAGCQQPVARSGSIYADTLEAMSEDCLFLNVWAPARARDAPVFVWIHGGSLAT